MDFVSIRIKHERSRSSSLFAQSGSHSIKGRRRKCTRCWCNGYALSIQFIRLVLLAPLQEEKSFHVWLLLPLHACILSDDGQLIHTTQGQMLNYSYIIGLCIHNSFNRKQFFKFKKVFSLYSVHLCCISKKLANRKCIFACHLCINLY